jgi:hypothetical protein
MLGITRQIKEETGENQEEFIEEIVIEEEDEDEE